MSSTTASPPVICAVSISLHTSGVTNILGDPIRVDLGDVKHLRVAVVGNNTGGSRAWAYEIVGAIQRTGLLVILTQTTTARYESDSAYNAALELDGDDVGVAVGRVRGSDYDAIDWKAVAWQVNVGN